jgi:biotin operon repressor
MHARATLAQGFRALDLMASGPISVADLALDLGVSHDTIQRIIAGAREAGIGVLGERHGRRVLYSLPTPPRWLGQRTLAAK